MGLEGKNFLLGVGAQRTGTTWLHNYLASSSEAGLPLLKELHYFDAKYLPQWFGNWPARFEQRLGKFIAASSGKPLTQAEKSLLRSLISRVRMNLSPEAYWTYFDRLAIDPRRVVGEFTPTYSLCGKLHLADIRSQIVGRGARPRIVFVMRDPADRFWSHVRFRTPKATAAACAETFRAALDDPLFLNRGYYDAIVANLRGAFPASELWFGFHESLFEDETLADLCRFLGIGVPAARQRPPRNAAADVTMSAEQRATLRAKYSSVYRFARKQFGSRVPDRWDNA